MGNCCFTEDNEKTLFNIYEVRNKKTYHCIKKQRCCLKSDELLDQKVCPNNNINSVEELNKNLDRILECGICQDLFKKKFLFSMCNNKKCAFVVCEECTYKYISQTFAKQKIIDADQLKCCGCRNLLNFRFINQIYQNVNKIVRNYLINLHVKDLKLGVCPCGNVEKINTTERCQTNQTNNFICSICQNMSAINGSNTKNCPNCNYLISKNGGCNHMTCRSCQYNFCWICLSRFERDHICRNRTNRVQNKYDKNGFDVNGFNKYGYDKYGYDILGFNTNQINRLGFNIEQYNSCYKNGYNYLGFDINGFNKNGMDSEGYDKNGFNGNGYDREEYDKDGFNRNGYGKDGFDRNGFGRDGYDRNGYDKDGYDKDGFDLTCYNKRRFNKERDHESGTAFDADGYDFDGFDINGFDPDGYDRNGYNYSGYDRRGYNHEGYNNEGYDRRGYNLEGINREGHIRTDDEINSVVNLFLLIAAASANRRNANRSRRSIF
jgi:IBR domain